VVGGVHSDRYEADVSANSDGFGAGIATVLAILLFLTIGYLVGVGVMSSWISSDCRDFGKTSITGNWYDCRPMEKK
jgi:hypothetical protein